eukprot:TRINITY_DN109185_c0_g1_i1.p1 TRINITY_DN109185_c0_g1~~TRINITY_DN109185_c0_g1_i1.p1  ORF type:complete len:691 (-),score=54.41 TRINITY_DN109185_c0_g1_i1:131-2203(-)
MRFHWLCGLLLLSCATIASSQSASAGDASNDANKTNCSNGTNGTNGSNCTEEGPCLTGCCWNTIVSEATAACKEFEAYGADDSRCKIWAKAAQDACNATCSSCEAIASALYDQCTFTLIPKMSYEAATLFCKQSRDIFQNSRCPSACIDRVSMCFNNPQFLKCNRQCGNYYNCQCSRQRGTAGAPDKCTGKTILPGPDGLPENCDFVPQTCKNHWPREECGMWRHCLPDLCIIQGVVCPILDSCQSVGVCAPADGKCYYSNRPDGDSCTDGLFYTNADTCYGGKCIGIEDKCARYDVKCHSTNPCLIPTPLVPKSCDPRSGSCVFESLPDETACASEPGGTIDGMCYAGLCRKNVTDLCKGKVCPVLGACYHLPTCDPDFGICNTEQRPEGTPCSDNDGRTARDKCVEGKCIGDPILVPSYSLDREEDCRWIEKNMPSYSGYAAEREDCEMQCSLDVTCIAFSYGYYACFIYTREKRTRNPDMRHWNKEWVLDFPDSRSRVTHSMMCLIKEQEATPWLVINAKAAWFGITVAFLVSVPALFFLRRFWPPLSKSFRRVTGFCGGMNDVIEEPGNDDVPLDDSAVNFSGMVEGRSHIEQNPAQYMMDDLEEVYIRRSTPVAWQKPLPNDPRGQVAGTPRSGRSGRSGSITPQSGSRTPQTPKSPKSPVSPKSPKSPMSAKSPARTPRPQTPT